MFPFIVSVVGAAISLGFILYNVPYIRCPVRREFYRGAHLTLLAIQALNAIIFGVMWAV
jgi:hypothetical protein